MGEVVAAATKASKRGGFEGGFEGEIVRPGEGETTEERLRRVWFDPVCANNRKETFPDVL